MKFSLNNYWQKTIFSVRISHMQPLWILPIQNLFIPICCIKLQAVSFVNCVCSSVDESSNNFIGFYCFDSLMIQLRIAVQIVVIVLPLFIPFIICFYSVLCECTCVCVLFKKREISYFHWNDAYLNYTSMIIVINNKL